MHLPAVENWIQKTAEQTLIQSVLQFIKIHILMLPFFTVFHVFVFGNGSTLIIHILFRCYA